MSKFNRRGEYITKYKFDVYQTAGEPDDLFIIIAIDDACSNFMEKDLTSLYKYKRESLIEFLRDRMQVFAGDDDYIRYRRRLIGLADIFYRYFGVIIDDEYYQLIPGHFLAMIKRDLTEIYSRDKIGIATFGEETKIDRADGNMLVVTAGKTRAVFDFLITIARSYDSNFVSEMINYYLESTVNNIYGARSKKADIIANAPKWWSLGANEYEKYDNNPNRQLYTCQNDKLFFFLCLAYGYVEMLHALKIFYNKYIRIPGRDSRYHKEYYDIMVKNVLLYRKAVGKKMRLIAHKGYLTDSLNLPSDMIGLVKEFL